MKRIFYFSNFNLIAYHWQSKKCIATYIFNTSPQALEKFKTYLLTTKNTPVRILVDLIDEDFIQETIPHVGMVDRKSIITRLIRRQYKDNKDYMHYRIIDREKSGRRDDILLYSVLNNPQILDTWLNLMTECNTSICGIWSLAILNESLLNKLNHKTNNVLFVSQQTSNILRQTFIVNSKVRSSRSTIINLEDLNIGEYISAEIKQTIEFLSNQKQIIFNKKIDIHILCREKDITKIQLHLKNTTSHCFHYHTLHNITKLFDCDIQPNKKLSPDDYSAGIYSYLCSEKILPIGHYKRHNLFTHFYQKTLSKAIYVTAAFSVLTAMTLAFYYISEISTLKNETLILTTQEKTILRQNKKEFFDIQHKLSQAQIMQSSVLLAKKIQKNKQLSPQNFMIDISHVLSGIDMRDTEITRIIWRLQQGNLFSSSIDYADSTPINQHATIAGFIQISNSNLKSSINKLNIIVDAFENHPLIEHVKINHMPIDIRSKSNMENESRNMHQENIKHSERSGPFEIELALKGHEI